jgi:hypothetical protein
MKAKRTDFKLEKLQALRSKANKSRKAYWNEKINDHFFDNSSETA